MRGKISAVLLAGVSFAVLASAARADVVISKKVTANMSCVGGVCSPTAPKAVLNATDLANMLAGGDVTVNTGSGATNIVVKDGFSWTSTSRLTLDAMQSVEFDKPVTVAGTGAVTITTNDGGTGGDLLFGDKGNLTFWDTNSSLIIEGSSYTLVKDIATLAAGIAANPSGFYALANDYDAKNNMYRKAVIRTIFDGTFEGLGHLLSNVTIKSSGGSSGLFQEVSSATVRDVTLDNVNISGSGGAGALIGGAADAIIVSCHATGSITLTSASAVGGLVARSSGVGTNNILRSSAAVSINAPDASAAGGLVGISSFAGVAQSYATGDVTGGDKTRIGGLIGEMRFSAGVQDSYATGAVSGGILAPLGGLIGDSDQGAVGRAYSTGLVTGGKDRVTGGLIGRIDQSVFSFNYWDRDTSGEDHGFGVCKGDKKNCKDNIIGLTSAQLESSLPAGFDPAIWGEKKSINGGFPYLLANPPR